MTTVQNQVNNYPKVIVKKIVSADRERVFDCWTDPKLMQQWLFPGDGRAETTNELKVGGKYSHEMIFDTPASDCDHTATTKDGKFTYLHSGEYLEIDKPNKLVFSWTSPSVTETRVTVELRSLGSGTEVTITHELLMTEDSRAGHTSGWEGCLENLANLVARV